MPPWSQSLWELSKLDMLSISMLCKPFYTSQLQVTGCYLCLRVSFYLGIAVIVDWYFKDFLVFSVACRRCQIMSFQYPPQCASVPLFGVNINWFWYIFCTNQELRALIKAFLSNCSVLTSWDMSLISYSQCAKIIKLNKLSNRNLFSGFCVLR